MPLVEDAAEALGATYGARTAGAFGECAAFSFNGNKIITTSGGGMLVSHRRDIAERARHLATQAREPAPHYEHSDDRLQLPAEQPARRDRPRPAAIARRQDRAPPAVNDDLPGSRWRELSGLEFMPEAPYGRSNCWLTCVTVDPARVRRRSRDESGCASRRRTSRRGRCGSRCTCSRCSAGCAMAAARWPRSLFERGLCLPSGSSLDRAEQPGSHRRRSTQVHARARSSSPVAVAA